MLCLLWALFYTIQRARAVSASSIFYLTLCLCVFSQKSRRVDVVNYYHVKCKIAHWHLHKHTSDQTNVQGKNTQHFLIERIYRYANVCTGKHLKSKECQTFWLYIPIHTYLCMWHDSTRYWRRVYGVFASTM